MRTSLSHSQAEHAGAQMRCELGSEKRLARVHARLCTVSTDSLPKPGARMRVLSDYSSIAGRAGQPGCLQCDRQCWLPEA